MTSDELHRMPVGEPVYSVNDTHGLDTLTRQAGGGWVLRLSVGEPGEMEGELTVDDFSADDWHRTKEDAFAAALTAHDAQGEQLREAARAAGVEIGPSAAEQRDKLQAFKDYVHQWLDKAGVPADPESPHRAAGCRIGGRLAWVLSRLATTQADDCEPVTADWLARIGFQLVDGYAPGDSSLMYAVDVIGSEVKLLAVCLKESGSPGGFRVVGWMLSDFANPGRCRLPDQPTRGHVRRLMAALGVPLTGTPPG